MQIAAAHAATSATLDDRFGWLQPAQEVQCPLGTGGREAFALSDRPTLPGVDRARRGVLARGSLEGLTPLVLGSESRHTWQWRVKSHGQAVTRA